MMIAVHPSNRQKESLLHHLLYSYTFLFSNISEKISPNNFALVAHYISPPK